MCKRPMWFGLSLLVGLALTLAWLPVPPGYAAAPTDGLLLYNTLDSPAAIRDSAVGLDGTHYGGGRFVPGRVGNAFVAGPGDEAQVTFPSEVLNYRAGTIELWARISDIAGREIPWGPQPALINYFEESLHIDFDLHYNGNNGAGGGGLCGTAGKSMHSSTGDYGRTWTYDELIGTDVEGWHHYALVWDDAGLPGVDGGRAKVAVYLDGVLKSGQWLDYDGDAPDFLPIPSGVLRLRDDSEYHGIFWGDVTFDELKIWDHARIPQAGLLLYNTLDSPAAIRDSAVGLDGTHYGGGRFVPGQVGNAYVAGPGDAAQVTFPKEVLNYRAGTIELWARISDIAGREIPWGPQPSLVRLIDPTFDVVYDMGFTSNDGAGNGGLAGKAGYGQDSGSHEYWATPNYDAILGSDVEGWHHYALVWDERGLPGVDGGRAKVAVYLDGRLVTRRWEDYYPGEPDFVPLTGGRFELRYDSDYHGVFWGDVTYDELKVWDHARVPSPAWAHLPQAELVGTVGGPGAEVDYVDAMEVLESDPRTMILATQNFYLGSGAGEEARIYRLDLRAGGPRPATFVQSLEGNITVRSALLEASDGTIFTGAFGLGSYSTDAGRTWRLSFVGQEPPASIFVVDEFKGQVYAGTGFEPMPGEVYRWLGAGRWEKVLESEWPRTIVLDLEVHQGRLFVGTMIYACDYTCGGGVPVYVTDDGTTFRPTEGIPAETMTVHNLVSVGDELLALVNYRGDHTNCSIYRWAGQAWEFVSERTIPTDFTGEPPRYRDVRRAFSYNGALYDLLRLPDDTGDGIYRSTDLGRSWDLVAYTQGPMVMSTHLRGSILYLGSNREADGTASIYRIDLASLATFPATPILDAFNRSNGPLRSSWSGNEGRGGYQIIGQQLDVVGGGPISWSRSFGADQEVYVTLVHPDADGASQSLILKMQGRATRPWQQLTMLAVGHEYAGGANRLVIDRHIPGAGWVRLAERGGVILRDGDQLGARATADGMVRVYLNGIEQLSADAGPQFAGKSGRIGLWFIDAGEAWLDDVGGGTLP